ncbi:hypothetical protein HZH68_012203 [Vespula germanica]|uniref:Uncharacterized protein n=1 Tax=Vespula germanica TaxID=30212 RepID=A0A834JMT9_VESGE|nr:hypothetical protein HZH68_012203 [Vespula germanica]
MLSNLCLVLHDKALQLASMGRGHGAEWDDANRNRRILRAEANRSKDATKELETPDLELGPWKSADARPRKGPSELPLTNRASPVGYSPITQSDELYGAVEHVKSGWVMHECKGLWPIWSIYG